MPRRIESESLVRDRERRLLKELSARGSWTKRSALPSWNRAGASHRQARQARQALARLVATGLVRCAAKRYRITGAGFGVLECGV